MSVITRSRSPGVTREDTITRRVTEYTTKTQHAFDWGAPCEDGCELGTRAAFLANYSCDFPVGRHDVALVLTGEDVAAQLGIDGENCALNFGANAARCLASHLRESAELVESYNSGRAPTEFAELGLLYREPCRTCDSWIPGVWVQEAPDSFGVWRVVLGLDLRGLWTPLQIDTSPGEARCLANRLCAMALIVDAAN